MQYFKLACVSFTLNCFLLLNYLLDFDICAEILGNSCCSSSVDSTTTKHCHCFQINTDVLLNVSVNCKHYHPPGKFLKTAKSQPSRQIFLSSPRGQGFPGTPYLYQFYTFLPFSSPQSLICPLNTYKFLGRT